jgi:hypothetical protein
VGEGGEGERLRDGDCDRLRRVLPLGKRLTP